MIEKVENTPTDERNDRPLSIAMISNCGELELKIPAKVLEQQERLKRTMENQKKEEASKKDSDDDSESSSGSDSDRDRRSSKRQSKSHRSKDSDDDDRRKNRSSRSSRSSKHKKRSRSSSRSRHSRRERNYEDRKARSRSRSPARKRTDDGVKDNNVDPANPLVVDPPQQEVRHEPRPRSRSPEIKYKGRGAMVRKALPLFN